MTPLRLRRPRLSRNWMVALALFGAGGAIAVRLVELTVVQHAALEAMARAQVEDVVEIPGPRGDIVDRHGLLLATSVPVQVLAVEPRKISQAGLYALENAAGVPGRLAQRGRARWFLVRRDCDDEIVAKVNQLASRAVVPKDALHWGPGFKRHYPQGSVASHVLGFVNLDETLTEGVEKTCDNVLRSGETRVLRATDARGEALASLAGTPFPAPASAVMLTIDLRIQQMLEQALADAVQEHAARAAQGVVLDPATGDILALANFPTYDPARFNHDDPALHRNGAIEAPFEPGSVMKPLTAAALAEHNKVTSLDPVNCENGRWNRGKWSISDFHPNGWLTFAEVIARSSNIGIAKFALRLTPAQLYETLANLGLGRRTGVDLPAESPGRLPDYHGWHGPERDNIAFGHALSVTTLQLAAAYAVIADAGVRVQPRVVRAWGSPEGIWHPTPASPATQAVSRHTAAQVALWMLGVVEMDGGTGRRAAVLGYRVAGKTGTAEKVVNGRYDPTRNIATFAGFAPVANPAAVIVISIDEPHEGPHTGGFVAAPTFSTVMAETLRLLRVTPDYVPETAPVPTQQAEAAPAPTKTAATKTASAATKTAPSSGKTAAAATKIASAKAPARTRTRPRKADAVPNSTAATPVARAKQVGRGL